MSESRHNGLWRAGAERVLVLALWFGLVTGCGEVVLVAIRKFALHRLVRLSPHVVWMAPLADIALFVLAAIVLIAAGRLWPRLLALRPASTVFAALSFFTISLHYGHIAMYARTLLAVGLAVQTGYFIGKYPHRFTRLLTWTLGWPGGLAAKSRERMASLASLDGVELRPGPFLIGAAAIVATLAGAVHAWAWSTERANWGRLPSGAAGPNIVFIVWDTVRARSLSLYDYERPTTPRLDAFADGAAVFDRAFSTSPWTLPGHASMFTGRWHHELSADWESPLDATYPTIAEFLASKGYATAGFVANTYFGSVEHGLNRGFVHYEDYRKSPGQVLVSSALGSDLACGVRNEPACRLRDLVGLYELLGRKTARHVNRAFLRWLDRRPEGKPFFAFLNFMDAHAPYLPPEPFATRFGKGERGNPMHMERADWKWTPEQAKAEQDAYDGAIAFLDDQFGQLLGELDERGLLDNTIIVLTSDHGEEFLEHGVMSHSNSLYLDALHVPLVIRAPGRVPAGRLNAAVSVRDLPATLMDIMGINEHPFPGASLARHWSPGSAPRQTGEMLFARVSGRTFRPAHYPVSKGDMSSVIADPHQYILRGDGREELYDIGMDPAELNELSGAPELANALSVLRAQIAALTRTAPRRAEGEPR
jgi:arylsulfatase A-like enzyme